MSALRERGFSEPAARWFEETFRAPTPLQLAAWDEIRKGGSALLVAPTGSGKTLAAFFWAIDRLVHDADRGTRVVYVSPLKALAVDVDKNLRAPLAGVLAKGGGRALRVGVRTGDTTPGERAKMQRRPPDVLVTTPESLFLMVTSRMRDALAGVDTVIVDEIHALAGGKRGAHLAVTLERLEALQEKPIQRIGLSATVRPLDAVARYLAGHAEGAPRPVSIVDVPMPRTLRLALEKPMDLVAPEDVARMKEIGLPPVWASILPRVVDLVRSHRSTMVFVNSRAIVERSSVAMCRLSGEELVLPHHGSLAKERRKLAEDKLKDGEIPGIVCTSTLELGIDVGAVDLVVQIEAPPTIAAGLQRVGRSGHTAFGTSTGRVFSKHAGDLLAAAAVLRGMREGAIEAIRTPENPLDVLAQQLVAMAAAAPLTADDAFELVRRSEPFAGLARSSFDGVVELLAGRYPSTGFQDLRPRLVVNRKTGSLRAREGAARVVVANAGTIPDRGLFRVVLADGGEGQRGGRQVGELDEELVHETRAGDVLQLGATAWRVVQITFDRVLVEPGRLRDARLPFWKGDGVGRSAELGRKIADLTGRLATMPRADAEAWTAREHDAEPEAAEALVAYVQGQQRATGAVPDLQTLVVEELSHVQGERKVCVLSPWGRPIHAPLAMVLRGALEARFDARVDALWADDGIVFRLPLAHEVPDLVELLPSPDTIRDDVARVLEGSAVFAARFREAAGRALLLPKRRPGDRQPLWAQRKRAYDLHKVAGRFPDFPILLEAYRECMADVFDLDGLRELLARIRTGETRVVHVKRKDPSPFAKTLLFSYVGAFMYDDDEPAAGQKAAVDRGELELLLGDEDLSVLLDPDEIAAYERRLQRLGGRADDTVDGVADLLRELGDLSLDELVLRAPSAKAHLATLEAEGRVVRVLVAADERFVLVEDAAVYRAALGAEVRGEVPRALEQVEVPDPMRELALRFARTRGPFEPSAMFERFAAHVPALVDTLVAEGVWTRVRLARWDDVARVCDAGIFRRLKLHALSRRREAVETVDQATFARFSLAWHGVVGDGRGGEGDALAVVEQLEGAELPASALFADILPARLGASGLAAIEALMGSGEVVFRGVAPLGDRDGRIALHFADRLALLAPPEEPMPGGLAERVAAALAEGGAQFFPDVARRVGGFPPEVLDALWALVWAGRVTNDTLRPLRSRLFAKEVSRHVSRRAPLPPGAEGRWSLLPAREPPSAARDKALAETLLARHGVLTKGALESEGARGLWGVFRALEDRGRLRSGYFVERLGAAQLADPRAVARLADAAEMGPRRVVTLASTDPASPFGAAAPWPDRGEGRRPQRSAGTHVVVVDGRLVGWLAREAKACLTFSDDPTDLDDLATSVATMEDRGAIVLEAIDGEEPAKTPLGAAMARRGFVAVGKGLFKR